MYPEDMPGGHYEEKGTGFRYKFCGKDNKNYDINMAPISMPIRPHFDGSTSPPPRVKVKRACQDHIASYDELGL
jgi:hypothetical protein